MHVKVSTLSGDKATCSSAESRHRFIHRYASCTGAWLVIRNVLQEISPYQLPQSQESDFNEMGKVTATSGSLDYFG